MAPLDLFSPNTAEWFRGSFREPTPAQAEGWRAIAAGRHTLIHAPTGSGKTLAAFLWAIDRLSVEPVPAEAERCRVLYISPLKALAYDIERNLRAPLRGIRRTAALRGDTPADISVAMRTGDTTQQQRRQIARTPPDVLITTPESLYLMLTSQARQILSSVRWVIVDEIHSMAGSKRGSHLALSLERLEELTEDAPQRIGLSATQRPLEVIAEFLGGGIPSSQGWEPREVAIVDAPGEKQLEIDIVVPLADMTRPDTVDSDGIPTRSIWPSIYSEILAAIRAHRSTIVFANSRGLVERLASALNELAGEELVRAHHGSVSRQQRVEIEDDLKTGRLRCVVATSSLELGIDMEAVDLVILVESPSTVARGLQRVGRSGHRVGVPSKATVFPKHHGDLLEAAVVVDRMRAGLIEATKVPQNPLDVLAQQIVAIVAVADRKVDEVYDLVRRAGPYRSLARDPFEATLDMLSGRYPSDAFAELAPRIVWDRVAGKLTARRNARMLAVTNPGTIPDRGLFTVSLAEGGKVGELDEEMVYESRVGDTFVLGSSAWKISEITHDRVLVVPAPGAPAARLPFWHGDALGRSLETGRAIGEFVRTTVAAEPAAAHRRLTEDLGLDERAADNLLRYLGEEQEATGTIPTDQNIVVERFRDEIGDWRIVLLSPFGARVHAPWAMAVAARMRRDPGVQVDAVWSDDGFVLRFPDADDPPDPGQVSIEPDDVSELILDEIASSALFGARFREAAARALLLPRRRPGSRTPLWLQRRRSTSLLEAARGFERFPIVLEALREVLQEHFDMDSLRELLGELAARKVRVTAVDTVAPSPFASSLMLDFIASYMYEYDAPTAERKALALTIDRRLLAELLGEPALRELLDPEVIASVELEGQALTEHTKARDGEGVQDLLRRLGPLTTGEVEARTKAPATPLLDELREQRRVVEVTIGGRTHWTVPEDVARLRDALGVQPPPGIPEPLLEPVADPLGDIVSRWSRTHGPFTTGELAAALGLPPAVAAATLAELAESGRVVPGAFRPQEDSAEWVDAEVLRRIRRRSLAKLRRQVEAVEPERLASFLPAWQGIGEGGSTPGRLLEVVGRLQGVAIPASVLEADALRARLDYTPDLLDALLAAGEIVWVGRGPLAGRDGRVALYRRDHIGVLHRPFQADSPDGELHTKIRNHLARGGASFFADIYAAAGGGDPESVIDALWDLVWAGEVTNDTLAPLRAFLWGKARTRKGNARRLPGASAPAAASGRWSLVTTLLSEVSGTARQAAMAQQLLERHGVVVRDSVRSEGLPGGFAALYSVFSGLEEAGKVRRGYFVEGLGGAQFALAGAVERLRSTEAITTVLAASDPANPYGAALPWPQSSARPARRAGAHVGIVAGRAAVFVDRGRSVVTFPDSEAAPEQMAAAITDIARRRGSRSSIETIDGAPASESSLAAALQTAGFTPDYRGLSLRP